MQSNPIERGSNKKKSEKNFCISKNVYTFEKFIDKFSGYFVKVKFFPLFGFWSKNDLRQKKKKVLTTKANRNSNHGKHIEKFSFKKRSVK